MFTKHELETILFSLEGYIQGNDDDKLCDELVTICDKIIEELAPAVTITPSKVTITDDDYASKVDKFVEYMRANNLPNDNVFTHDSEGC